MANRNEAKVNFTADTKQFTAEIQKADSTMQQLRAELKLNEAQMKASGNAVDGLKNKQKLLTEQHEAQKTKVEALTQKLQVAIREWGEGTVEVDKWRTKLINAQRAEVELENAINQCNSELQEAENATNQAENATETLTEKISRQQTELQQLKSEYIEVVDKFGETDVEAQYLAKEINKLSGELKENQTRLKDASQSADEFDQTLIDTSDGAETLTDKVKRQQAELNQLKSRYVDVCGELGETSDEAQRLEREIGDLSGELKQSKDAFSDAAKKADDLDKSMDSAGDAAAGSADGFTIAKGAIADLASAAVQLAIEKVAEFIGYLTQLPEATRELRQDLATLDTSFEKQGFTVDQAKETWKGLYTIFGEDDRAVEAANHISKMADNQQELNDWVTITQGVWGTYQDSLPVEGLAEASNETAKTGKVTGVLADALNWSSEAATMFSKYMNEDVVTAEDAFNEALKECTTEEERQSLITETLTALYGDAAQKYEEASGSQLEAKEAAADLALAEAELADTVEPATTVWAGLKTELIQGIMPAVEAVSGAFIDVLGWAKEHPKAIMAIAAVLGTFATALTVLAVAAAVYTAAQWTMNTALLASPFTWIVLAIAAVIAIIAVCVIYWDEIKAAAVNAWEWIKNAWNSAGEWFSSNVVQPVVNFFSGLWDGICNAAQSAWDWVKNAWNSAGEWFSTNVVQPIVNFFVGLWNSAVNIWDKISNAVQVGIMFIGSIISAAIQIITLPWRFLWENCRDAIVNVWSKIKNAVSSAINFVKNIVVSVTTATKNTAVNIWNSLKNATQNAFNAVKNFVSPIWNSVKNGISNAVTAAKSKVSNIWNSLKNLTSSAFNAVKNLATSIWSGTKNAVIKAVNSAKSAVSNTWNSLKSLTSSAFNSIKSKATSIFNSVKTAITKPIDAAKAHIKSALNAIKGFFSGLKLKFPNIKLPHFSITGKFSLDPPSVPKLSIEWYKNGGIMMKPTIFGINGNSLMAGGEAGPEAILPIEKLEGYITGAIEKTMQIVNLDTLAAAVEDLANRPIQMNINGRQFAVATAGDSDSVNGLRSTFRSRGLELD